MCGTCDTDSSNDCVQDCAGVWGGESVCGSSWTDLAAIGGDNQITLEWSPRSDRQRNSSDSDGDTECEEGFVEDCSSDGDCCPESWIGDGFEDCELQTFECDLSCYDNDGGDCTSDEWIELSCIDMDDSRCSYVISFCNTLGNFGDDCPCQQDEEGFCIDSNSFISIEGCTDNSACNYNIEANWDDGSCQYTEDNYNCEGNCTAEFDCFGECGGSAEVDECGECGGDGSSCSGSSVSIEIRNVDTTAGTLDIYMINSIEVGGFQFQLTSIEITGASGGIAESLGFLLQTDGTDVPSGISKVLGFSLTGTTIPIGEDVLATVSFSDYEGTDICFGTDPAANLISDSGGGELDTEWGDCSCSPDNPADECGECGGPGIADDECDCDGNGAEIECGEGTALFDLFGEGHMVCDESLCAGISYNIYRDGQYLTNSGVATEYIDMEDLGYSESHCYTVTEVTGDGESNHSDEACATTNAMPNTPGCTFETACNHDQDAVVNDGSCWFGDDICGCDAGQTAVVDNCGSCVGGNTGLTACAPDCNGDWGGDAELDDCGVCNGDNDCVDCNGDPFGNAVYDKCGEECIAEAEDPLAECSAYCDADTSNDCDQDCDGIWGGDALEDMCGTCDNNSSNDCVQDCADVWGGTGEIDLFGACCTDTEDNECIITGCDLPDSTLYLTETYMAFNSSKAIKQIKLTMEGSVIPSAPLLGVAGDAGFVWLGYSETSNWVLGKNQNAGTSIPSGNCGNLFNIEYLNNPVSISVEIKDDNDIVIDFSAYFNSGCSEESACNYNPYSIDDIDGSCEHPEGNYDCDGNFLSIDDILLPNEYMISNIYPNPFNPITNIEYSLPKNTFVQIRVYDIKGRQISILINSFQFAGYYSITWDASDSPSGVYFIDMISDGFKQTQQVVLMK